MKSDYIDKKHFSRQITERFVFAMDRIIGSRSAGKVTAQSFGEIVGIASSNLKRLRDFPEDHTVTVEAIGRLCDHYKISPYWLITGQGDMYNNDELYAAYQTLHTRISELEKSISIIEQTIKIIKDKKK